MKNSFRLHLVDLTRHVPVQFGDIPTFIPDDWFVMKKTTSMLSCGHTLPAKSNGQDILLILHLRQDGLVKAEIAGQEIDLTKYGIPSSITYTYTAVPALFRSMNVIRPCLGYNIDKQGTCKISSDNVRVLRETISKAGHITHALRSPKCFRSIPLTSKGDSCIKCIKCGSSIKRKYDCDKNDCDENDCDKNDCDKENEIEHADGCDDYEDPSESTSIRMILKSLAPNLTDNQVTLIESQIKASNLECKNGMRWDKDIISISISIYNRNPGVYRNMVQNGWLQLPSESLLSLYKNAVRQGPGIIPDMMQWMQKEASRQKLPKQGYFGGIILDEMSIQEDLQIVNYKDGTKLYGIADSDPDVKRMKTLSNDKVYDSLANHVQQYMFNGLTGFRWPFANFPNCQADPSETFVTTWKCIHALGEYGFIPLYCCMDGSANNRAFLKMHFNGDPILSKMVAPFFQNPRKRIIFIMDPSHLLKKIRNSLLSSGFLESHQRLLCINNKVIIWKMWVDAFNWDQLNSFPLHKKLTKEHIYPNNAQKMRNKLAFDCLDDDMHNLMFEYSKTLTPPAQDELGGTLELLKQTAFMVRFFRDPRPITSTDDPRLASLKESYNWFKSWEKERTGDKGAHRRENGLLTMECREDLDFLFHGFMSLVELCNNDLKIDLVPSRVNSDVIENIFCQERSLYHGANTNPNYNEYRTGINSIILGQTTTSRKSNVGGGKEAAKPYAIPSLQRKKAHKE